MTAPKKFTHEEIRSHMDGHLAAPEPAETDDNAARYIDCLHDESVASLRIIKQLLAEVEAVTRQIDAWRPAANHAWARSPKAHDLMQAARELDHAPAISKTETSEPATAPGKATT